MFQNSIKPNFITVAKVRVEIIKCQLQLINEPMKKKNGRTDPKNHSLRNTAIEGQTLEK